MDRPLTGRRGIIACFIDKLLPKPRIGESQCGQSVRTRGDKKNSQFVGLASKAEPVGLITEGTKHTLAHNGERFAPIPRHGKRELKTGTVRGILKQLGIEDSKR